MQEKQTLRAQLRQKRRDYVAALPESTRGLLFRRPPAAINARIPDGAIIGLYSALPAEAPAEGYARWFFESGHRLALPFFGNRSAAMQFRAFRDPHGESDLAVGPFGMLQPDRSAPLLEPDVLFMPLIGFDAQGGRLGQGGGHYDRWLADHPGKIALGLAWDCQLLESFPREIHDQPLSAVITPTRLYGPFQQD